MLDAEGKILLMHRNTAKRVQWELPGGKIEVGEEEGETAQREVEEELGIAVTIVRKLGEKSFGEGEYAMDYAWFLATIDGGVPSIQEKNFDALQYFSWDELQSRTNLSANAKNLVTAYFNQELELT